MSEEAPAAQSAEPTTPTAPAPEAPASTPEPQPAQPVATPEGGATNNYFTNEQLEEMQRFISNNGGYDKVWSAAKQAITAPKPKEPEQPQKVEQPQNTEQNVQQPEYAPGSYSMEEMAALSYFERLANDPKYASIADEIRDGKVLDGLKSFNITPVSNGRINDADVRKYLDLYAATKPAQPTSATPSGNSQVDYVPVEKVTSMEEATKIQLQNIQLRNAGLPEHPLSKEASEFVKSYYRNKK